MWQRIVFALSVLLLCCLCTARSSLPGVIASDVAAPSGVAAYTVEWYDQLLDHFGSDSKSTWKQQWLYNDTFWGHPTDPSVSAQFRGSTCRGPVLFYTGNEGAIGLFWNNTGFVTGDLIYRMGALVVFVEHRYFGQSMPFGSSSFEPGHVQYLSVEQALADYAYFLKNLPSELAAAADCPVVAFGGSYGGMLSGWFRMQYPDVVAGSVAASAPILSFPNTGVSQWAYMETTTNTFRMASSECPTLFEKGLEELAEELRDSSRWADISEQFKLCAPLRSFDDGVALVQWIEGGIQYLAMEDYPYPNAFLTPVPGYAVNVFCDFLAANYSSSSDPTIALSEAIKVYFNWTGQSGDCYNTSMITDSPLGNNGWNYLACTEIVFPISSNGTSDMFLPAYFNLEEYAESCSDMFPGSPAPNTTWYQQSYGLLLNSSSNIIFSNGNLDPWSSGGVKYNVSETVTAVIIEGGAHHLDMRMPVPSADPQSVVIARNYEYNQALKWMSDWMSARRVA